jgi:hypothetical protein
MRAREFLKEDEHQFDISNPAMTRARYFPNMDRFYELYRLTLDMASSNSDTKNDIDGTGWPSSNNAVMLAYTKEEDDLINKTLKKRGFTQKRTTSHKSSELTNSNKLSPVAKIKKNRFGI